MLRLPLMFALVATAAACNPLKTKPAAKVQPTSLATPFTYGMEDPNCYADAGETTLASETIESWNGSAFAGEAVDFAPFAAKSTAEDGLTSTHISATGFGMHQRTTKTCTVSPDNAVSCDDGATATVSQVKALKVCNPAGSYGRDSVEGVSLATMANIERMRLKYNDVPGVKALERALLLVMPNFETVIKAVKPSTDQSRTSTYSQTDNAAFAAGKSSLFFVVYPRSVELSQKAGWDSMRLWEVPWVIGHEFSHQIFYTYYSRYREDNATSDGSSAARTLDGILASTKPDWRQTLADGGDAADDKSARLPGESHAVGMSDALTAVNEGFADTFATYSLGAPKAIFCFDVTRDVTSPAFADGQPKVLSQVVRNKFFSADAAAAGADLCAVSYQDVHAIGAILAHGIHRILTAGGADAVPSLALQTKALAWLTAFDAARSAGATPDADGVWTLAVQAALTTAKGSADTLPAATCDIARQVFPVLADKALAGFSCR